MRTTLHDRAPTTSSGGGDFIKPPTVPTADGAEDDWERGERDRIVTFFKEAGDTALADIVELNYTPGELVALEFTALEGEMHFSEIA